MLWNIKMSWYLYVYFFENHFELQVENKSGIKNHKTVADSRTFRFKLNQKHNLGINTNKTKKKNKKVI